MIKYAVKDIMQGCALVVGMIPREELSLPAGNLPYTHSIPVLTSIPHVLGGAGHMRYGAIGHLWEGHFCRKAIYIYTYASWAVGQRAGAEVGWTSCMCLYITKEIYIHIYHKYVCIYIYVTYIIYVYDIYKVPRCRPTLHTKWCNMFLFFPENIKYVNIFKK